MRSASSSGRRARAAAGTALFGVIGPGVVAGLVPWAITGWQADHAPPDVLRVAGACLVAVSTGILLESFARFAREGVGTPAPVAPTERLVVGGLYRHVRNPMYLAVLGAIAGQAMIFASAALAAYGAIVGVAEVAFARIYEERVLLARFGAAYAAYREAVPGWMPRLEPYRAGPAGAASRSPVAPAPGTRRGPRDSGGRTR